MDYAIYCEKTSEYDYTVQNFSALVAAISHFFTILPVVIHQQTLTRILPVKSQNKQTECNRQAIA
jgi:hypothetical protein